MQIVLDFLKMFKPSTTTGEILKLHENGDIDVYEMIESLVDTEYEKVDKE